MVILCGGLATRLGDLAKNIPKSMIDINGKPFLEYQIENVKKHGIKDIILCVGHLSEKIEKYFGDGSKFNVIIRYSYDGEKPLGSIGALRKAKPLLDNDFFIMYGDSYLSVDFQKVYSFYEKHDKPACMVVYKNYNKFDKSNIVIKDEMVTNYGNNNAEYIDYGTSLLNKKTLNYIPENTFYDTEEFFSKLIEKNWLLAFEVTERFYHIGTPEALEKLRDFIKNR
jgi:NDP-sugar pyrophosphorylase family protein